jgi:hypothetical protein
MNPLTQSKNTIILPVLIALTLACFALAPQARATCQEGCLTTFNTVLGDDALLNNTAGTADTAIGYNALHNNTIGGNNTATGYRALLNSTGSDNTATGADALNKTTGGSNTATGEAALFNNTTGSNNTAVGFNAGSSLTTGSNNIDIGSNVLGISGESNTIRLGKKGIQTKTVIAGIRDTTVSGGVAVMIDSNGRLGTVPSSARYKENIEPMDKASETILALKPVTFRYKHELDSQAIPQYGLVAEDVEKVNPALVARDDQGKPYTVRYDAVNAMLLNEFLKEHRKVEQLTKDFESKLAEQQKQIDTLTAGLQKVSVQLEASKPAQQVVNNP